MTPGAIREIEIEFVAASKDLLKFEWQRVKRGERFFRITKWGALVAAVAFSAMMAYKFIWQETDFLPPETSFKLHLLDG